MKISRNTWASWAGILWILIALTGCGGNSPAPVQPGMNGGGGYTGGGYASGNLVDQNPGTPWYAVSDQAKREVYYGLVGALSGQRQTTIQGQTVVDYQTWGNVLQPQQSQPSNAQNVTWAILTGQPTQTSFYLGYADYQYQTQMEFMPEVALPGTRLFSTDQVALFVSGSLSQGQMVVAKVPARTANPTVQIFFVSGYGTILHVVGRTLVFGQQPQYPQQNPYAYNGYPQY